MQRGRLLIILGIILGFATLGAISFVLVAESSIVKDTPKQTSIFGPDLFHEVNKELGVECFGWDDRDGIWCREYTPENKLEELGLLECEGEHCVFRIEKDASRYIKGKALEYLSNNLHLLQKIP